MNAQEIALKFKKTYVPVWAPPEDFAVSGGKGGLLFDMEGKGYIDFVTGIAVNALGYQHPALIKACREFQRKPFHVSSLFLHEERVLLAEMLVENSFADRIFFCNSGTEAIEACIKFARKWAFVHFGAQKNQIISFYNGFHGRTYGALSATAQEKFHQGFEPLVPGFKYLAPNDLAALEREADEKSVCAVLAEPLQAEGGLLPCRKEWLASVRELCTRRNILFILDEIQTGMGRLGTLWGYQSFGVEPDLMAAAKALGGGIPFGAVLCREAVSSCLKTGDHGNTTGGSPLAAKLGRTVLAEIIKPGFLEATRARAGILRRGLEKIVRQFPDAVEEARGMGMLQGLALKVDVAEIIKKCRGRGLLVCKAGSNVLRLIPPLNVKPALIRKALEILHEVFRT